MSKEYIHFNYLSLNKKFSKNTHLIATFRIESGKKLRESSQIVAAESSIGTWTDVDTLTIKTFTKLSARVIKLFPNINIAVIAYPLALFEPGNIAQLLSCIAGNIFSMKVIKNIRLLDLEMPEQYINSFSGPAIGLDGIRKRLGVKKRPLLGCIIKPKIGLSWKQHAQVAYKVFKGGIDLVKDDENLTDLKFNPFAKRVKETVRLARKAEKETGSKKICAFNISAPANEMIKRAELVKKYGGHCAMVDIMTVGFSGLQALRQKNLGLILHGHRAMHSAMTRNLRHGISMLVIAKLARLGGIDQLHTGTVVGKMDSEEKEVLEINKFLKKRWGNIKPVLPIASGGLHPGLIPKLYKIIGPDMIMNFGGGLHGHPEGSYQGAIAVNEAITATMNNKTLEKYANSHKALALALKKWGRK